MEVSVDARSVEGLRRELGDGYQRGSERAAVATLRKAATRVWWAARAQADLRRDDRRRRVYVRRRRSATGASLWVGFSDIPAHRVRGAVTGTGASTRIHGRSVQRVFRTRIGRPAFRRLGERPTPIELYRIALEEYPLEAALGDVDEQYQQEVLQLVEKLARGDA